MSTEKIIELEKFEANSFAGIDKSNPVVIDFTKRNKKYNVVELIGDQEVGKTSSLMGVMFAMGAAFDIDKKKLCNSEDGKIDVNLKFTYDGDRYHVIADDKRTILKKLSEDGKWRPEDSPMNMLRKIFGPVGLSPFAVREMKGRDQIKYLQEMFGVDEGASKKMKKLEEEVDDIFIRRRDANREVTALKNALEIEPLYQNYEASMTRFAKPLSAEKEKAAFDTISKNKSDYDRYAENLNMLKASHKDAVADIERLKKELAEAEALEKELATRVEKGDKWMADNKDVPVKYEAAQKDWLNLSKTLADQEKWKDIMRREKQFNEKTELATDLTGQLDEKREQLLKLTKKCLPDVPGLDIKVATGLDKTDKPEGVFFNDQPIHELSESQYTALWCEIFDAAGVNFIFLENITSFGSKAISIFNELAKNGAIVFATRMDRKVKEMGVSFKNKIE